MYTILEDISQLEGKIIVKVFEPPGNVVIFITKDKSILGLQAASGYGGEGIIEIMNDNIDNIESYIFNKNTMFYEEIVSLGVFDNDDYKTYETKQEEKKQKWLKEKRNSEYQQYLNLKKQFGN